MTQLAALDATKASKQLTVPSGHYSKEACFTSELLGQLKPKALVGCVKIRTASITTS